MSLVHLPPAERLAAYGQALSLLIAQAERDGVILTVERRPRPDTPLAMGNHTAHVEAYASAALRRAIDEANRPRLVLQ